MKMKNRVITGVTLGMGVCLSGMIFSLGMNVKLVNDIKSKTAIIDFQKKDIKRLEETSFQYLKGKLVAEEAIEQKTKELEELTAPPVVQMRNTPVTKKAVPQANSSGKTVKANVSYYCACYECTQSGKGITASGAKVVEGVTIAAPKNIPFGTKITIDGTTYTVQDRGGAIVKNGEVYHFDVYTGSHAQAMKNGRKVTTAVIH